MSIYNGQPKASHCKRLHKWDSNIVSYLRNETYLLTSRDLYQKLMNTNNNYYWGRSLYQKLIQLINNNNELFINPT